ncbi:hypothetical protein ACJMK2_007332 [Sinanodonta woodiana]|uniref:VWFA domain-containing protein n=1 Tax=Sinanodonta woodiana TaxID=1069815 RepID=A0ABD3VKR4_SINWO
MEIESLIIFGVIVFLIYWFYGRGSGNSRKEQSNQSERLYPDLSKFQESSIFRMFQSSNKHSEVILDKFTTVDDVRDALRNGGLDSCSLIFGIDFTASNVHQGLKTYGGRNLHHLDLMNPNPYQKVISILGETLESLDDDGLIPVFGFGDASTRDHSVFPFLAEGYCRGFQDVLSKYNQIVPNVQLSGPTSFAPIIYKAIDIVKRKRELCQEDSTRKLQYHILIIVADGQVTSERPTREAIVEASKWPISIILVGVGDGPWEEMEEFDDGLPARKFDNFQFVDYHRIISTAKNPHAAFALCALMEIPDQYKKIKQLGLLNF